MKRIAENTYVDNTFVTCAEYQLFIDEMREQEKYYQPDHWTSHQFPKGRGWEPILGIRRSDALAFCEWLSQREGGELKFRLPNPEEANVFPIKLFWERPLGCWVDGDASFTWIGSVPENKYTLDINHARSLISDLTRVLDLAYFLDLDITDDHALEYAFELAHDSTLARAFRLSRAIKLDLDHTINRARAIDRDLSFDYAIDSDRVRDLNRALNRALKLVRSFDHSRDMDRARAFNLTKEFELSIIVPDRALARALERISALSKAIDHAIRGAFEHTPVLNLDHAHNLAINRTNNWAIKRPRALTHDLARALNRARNFDLNIGANLPLDLDAFIALFTLRERIAGRSPAFEGIRLVKERIR